MSLIKIFIPTLAFILSAACHAASPLNELSKEGTRFRLMGDIDRADLIEAQLIAKSDEPIGHIFALNGIVTNLTWDENDEAADKALTEHVAIILEWCEGILAKNETDAKANYYCGQANFAVSYFHGLRGRYYQAGRHGTRSITYLEAALRQDPSLIDAKMHLGVAYYVADNLPAFIRMFSRFLWFIPTGNSEKSLPYLRDVVEHGDEYQDVARYIYSTLLLENPDLRPEARDQLGILVGRYPQNSRFQLRLISLLLLMHEFDETLVTAQAYLANEPVEPELSLAKIWMARAHMGLNRPDEAARLFSEVNPVFKMSREELPEWSIAWHMLTDGQLHDLANRREAARETYASIISLAKSTYVSQVVLDTARAGLLTPFELSP